MSVVHVIHSPISGIGLEGIDEIDLGGAKLFRNPAALAFAKYDLPFHEIAPMMPNIEIPHAVPIDNPAASFDAELRQWGIARYLLEVEIPMPTNTITTGREKEELEWAILPLRLLVPAQILTGNPVCFRGGSIRSGLLEGGAKERVRREGMYATAPILLYDIAVWTTMYAVTAEVAPAVTKLALMVNKHRETLKTQLGVAIDTFSNSFQLPSLTQRGWYLLIALETLFSRKGSKSNIRSNVVSRTMEFLGVTADRDARRSLREVVDVAFGVRKDIEHGKLAESSATAKFFAHRIHILHDAVRLSLLRAVHRIDAGENPAEFLPGLQVAAKRDVKRGRPAA